MLKINRCELILELIKKNKKNNIEVEALIKELKVSEATVRRDLTFLEECGKIKRVYGGAVLIDNEEEVLLYKKEIHYKEKNKIAKLAVSLINNGDKIYLDAGSTVFAMIKYLPSLKNIKVITNGIAHIEELNNYKIESYLIGGKIKMKTGALVGGTASMSLKNFNFDYAFMGANAVDINGYSTPDIEEATIKNEAYLKAKKSYFLCDESKFNKLCLINFASLENSYLITDKNPNDEIKNKIKKIYIAK